MVARVVLSRWDGADTTLPGRALTLRPFVSLDTIVDGRHNLWKAIAS
ncbi:MAG: hypothetical protein Q8Q29_07595 [Actinomycetota bacterium]|nr:hypothetical protein [Actinomycetota bacterium]